MTHHVIWEVLPLIAAALAAVALIALWKRTRSRLAGLGAAVAAMIALTLIYAPDVPPAPVGPLGRAPAVVRKVHRITRLGPQGRRGEDAPSQAFAPYQVVELAFVPEAGGDTVVATDAVDDGSVPALAPGSRVRVTYELAHPSVARIDGARRTFGWKNVVGMWALGSAVLVVIGVLLLGRMSLRRLRARAEGP